MLNRIYYILILALGLLMAGCKDDDSNPSENEVNKRKTSEKSACVLNIYTDGNKAIASKENYVGCRIQLDGKGNFDDYETPADQCDSIRGRGNSTWLWYDKKPYKIKLSKKASLCGIGKGKKYVLLANYRDPSRMMNAVTFDMARYLGMPFTNTNAFVEVYLNDQYIGLYQLTEQIEQGKNRVDIDKEKGLLLSLDFDDGPSEDPEGYNFYSEIFDSDYSPKGSWQWNGWDWEYVEDGGGLPVCVKYPEDPTPQQIAEIKAEFTKLEKVIKAKNYTALKAICNVESMMEFLFINEITHNVELVTPRSMYLYRDADGLWTFGPVWDFDGGFGYNWNEKDDRRQYFTTQAWLMGPQGSRNIPDLFDNMFNSSAFLKDYKALWNQKGEAMVDYALNCMYARMDTLDAAMQHEFEQWPTVKDYNDQQQKLDDWLTTRASNYTSYLKTW